MSRMWTKKEDEIIERVLRKYRGKKLIADPRLIHCGSDKFEREEKDKAYNRILALDRGGV